MSLNKYMHPRNRYKYNKPNFNTLAEKYPEFKPYVIDNPKGKAVIDFKNPEAVKVLTACLLREDFGISVEIPPERLVPTLPLRLNYIHWIEDISNEWGKKEMSGIDIGTGACCVYPVLAISGNPWQFLATEADEVNFTYAKKNLETNNLTEKIKVIKVSENTILEGVIGNTTEKYDFCMCNPPFFADHFEAQGLLSRTPNRPDPKTMSTASPQEGIVEGGEVGFVRKMIEESVFLQDRVRVYSSMLGKKASLGPLKEILRRHKVPGFATTEFCQGKTMRWGLAWTFDKSVTFPKSEFTLGKKDVKKPLVHTIPTAMGERREQIYDVVSFLKQVFAELQIHCRDGKQTKHFALLTLTAAENSWIHSRRKRRQMLREAAATTTTFISRTATTVTATKTEMSEYATALTVSVLEVLESAANVTASEMKEPENVTSSKNVETENADTASSQTLMNSADPEGSTGFDPMSHFTVEATDMADGNKAERPSEMDVGQEATEKENQSVLQGLDEQNEENGRNMKRKAVSSSSSACKLARDDVAQEKSLSDGPDPAGDAAPSEEKLTIKMETSEETSVNPIARVATSSVNSTDGCMHRGVEEANTGKTDSRPPAKFVLKCHASVRVQGPNLALEMSWLDGENIQLMHQLMQVLKNRLAARKTAT